MGQCVTHCIEGNMFKDDDENNSKSSKDSNKKIKVNDKSVETPGNGIKEQNKSINGFDKTDENLKGKEELELNHSQKNEDERYDSNNNDKDESCILDVKEFSVYHLEEDSTKKVNFLDVNKLKINQQDDNQLNEYCSHNSYNSVNSILSFNRKNIVFNSKIDPNRFASSKFSENKNKTTRYLLKNENPKFKMFFVEIKYFISYEKSEIQQYFSQNNLILILEFNDDPYNQEKIPLQIIEESDKIIKFAPILKKKEMSSQGFRFYKIFHCQDNFERPVKFKVKLVNYSKEKTFDISEESFFFNFEKEYLQCKLKPYINMLNIITNEKIGNLHFTVVYDQLDGDETIDLSKVEKMKILLPNVDKVINYNEDPKLPFLYYNKQNYPIQSQIVNKFTSINDISEGKVFIIKLI